MTEQERWDEYRKQVRRYWTRVPTAIAFPTSAMFDVLLPGPIAKAVEGGLWQQIKNAEKITPKAIERLIKKNPRHL